MTVVRFSGLELRFLQDRHGTDDSLDLFTMTVQPKARMPVAHYHETWDETVYGLSGTTTWRIADAEVAIAAGQSAFIRRGVVHGFRNDTDAPATCLVVLTPGVLGPAYFQEMADLANSGSRDPEAMKAVMTRYGLIPSP
jgi:quercetin dioxygenase-like cupin family protein